MSDRRLLVTGACGCIGAWVVHELVGAGEDVVSFDLSTDRRRLALLLEPEELERIPHVAGDISDLGAVERALDGHGITNVIHLAALQVPFCRADPPLGARVNVVGTANVFEAVRRRPVRIGPVVYASSIAAYDAPDGDRPPSMSAHPGTLYGVYKRANESTAHLYGAEGGVASVGLRPHIVYGVGRDQGLTSTVTAAMLAAAAGGPYTIPYGGSAQVQLAADVARAFVEASRAGGGGAVVHNLPGRPASVAEVITAITEAVPGSAGSIGYEDVRLPFPEEVDSSSFERAFPGFAVTSLSDGVRATTRRFAALLGRGAALAPAT